jgi:hypothetical protein
MSHNCVPVLDKGITIAFALRLAAKHHRDAESVIIRWIEHSLNWKNLFARKIGF